MSASTIFTAAFLTAALANFLFFTGLAGFVLLPLHLRRLGATDGELGLIMAGYSATAIVVQPRGGRSWPAGWSAEPTPASPLIVTRRSGMSGAERRTPGVYFGTAPPGAG